MLSITSLPLLAAGLLVASLTAWGGAEHLRAEKFHNQLLEERNARALAVIKSVDVAREEEGRRAEEAKGIDREMSNYRTRLEADRAKIGPALAAGADRLRRDAATLAGGCSLPSNSTASEPRQDASALIADILGACAAEYTKLAGEADTELDKVRSASLECEKRYDSLTGDLPAP